MKNSFQPLQIDFSPQSVHYTFYQLSISTWCLLVCATFALIFAITDIIKHQIIKNNYENVLQELSFKAKTANKKNTSVKPTLIPDEKINSLNQVIARLNLPWSDLFDALENASSSQTALLLIEPDIKNKNIQLQLEAKNNNEMFAYIQKLKTSPFLKDIYLVKHETRELDINKPVRFQLNMRWEKDVN